MFDPRAAPRRFAVVRAPSGARPARRRSGGAWRGATRARLGAGASRTHRCDRLAPASVRGPRSDARRAQRARGRRVRCRTRRRGRGVLDAGDLPLVLGDCSVLLGGALALRRGGGGGLLFLDGHADFYQPSAEPLGEAASMDLALATGHGPPAVGDLEGPTPLVRDQDAVVVGFRDAEEQARDGSQPLPSTLLALDLAAVRATGAPAAAERAIAHLTRPGAPDRFWVHLDADVLDDAVMPAVGLPSARRPGPERARDYPRRRDGHDLQPGARRRRDRRRRTRRGAHARARGAPSSSVATA